MMDSLLNLVFRCRHTRLTRPVTPVTRPGEPPPGSTYVVCLDCGKHFDYDPIEMRIVKPAVRRRWTRALLAIPFAVLIGSLFRRNRRTQQKTLQ
jgi:hypothetical protein